MLEASLHFSDADLAANRDGRLSPRQAGSLRWSGVWRLIVGPPATIAAVLGALLVDSAFFDVFALLVAGFGLYLTWRGFAYLVDAMETTVAYLTGTLGHTVVRGKYTAYYATIGPISHKITAAAYNRLPIGRSFHLYYAPGCRSLLSMEPASAAEPKPAHMFGPDSAHVWDRLRWSWVVMTVGVLGALIGAHAIASAHPAHPVAVSGTVTDYVETHGKTTTRTLYLDVDGSFSPESESSYAPPVASFGTLIGKKVVLYVNAGTSNVLAIDDGEQLHATDWYMHPEHQTAFETVNGGVTAALSVIALAIGMALLISGRRHAAGQAADPDAAPALYIPPSPRPLQSMWSAVFFIGIVMGTIVLLVGLANHR